MNHNGPSKLSNDSINEPLINKKLHIIVYVFIGVDILLTSNPKK